LQVLLALQVTGTVLQTERIKLVRPSMELLTDVQVAVRESRADLEKYLSWVEESLKFPEKNMSEAMQRHESFTGELRYYIKTFRESGIAGSIGLIVRDIEVPFFEVGYWVRSSCSGQGFVTEALGLIEQYAFDDLKARRLEIRMAKANLKSRNLAEKAGYVFEGELANERRLPTGEITNTLIYAKSGL
jgi:RimJ/RimL family protein N-acetyltransferase